MYVTYEPFPNGIYPGDDTPTGKRTGSQFRTELPATVRLLKDEVSRVQLSTDDDQIVVQLGYHEHEMKRDGSGPKANTTPFHPGVTVKFERNGSWLSFSSDRFTPRGYNRVAWKENLHAVAKGLEYLRGLERYGVGAGGQQYRGFAELGPGAPTPLGSGDAMTVSQAAAWMAEEMGAEWDAGDLEVSPGVVGRETLQRAYRVLARSLHPDGGGTPEGFAKLQSAHAVLLKAVR